MKVPKSVPTRCESVLERSKADAVGFLLPPEFGCIVGPHRAIVDGLAQHPGQYRRKIDSVPGLPGTSLPYRR